MSPCWPHGRDKAMETDTRSARHEVAVSGRRDVDETTDNLGRAARFLSNSAAACVAFHLFDHIVHGMGLVNQEARPECRMQHSFARVGSARHARSGLSVGTCMPIAGSKQKGFHANCNSTEKARTLHCNMLLGEGYLSRKWSDSFGFYTRRSALTCLS